MQILWNEISVNLSQSLLESTYNFLWPYVNGLMLEKTNKGFRLKAFIFSSNTDSILKKLQNFLRIQARSFNVKYETPSVCPVNPSFTNDFIIVPHPTAYLPPFGIPILIQRGRAFGTGSHPCTFYCLDGLKNILKSNNPKPYTGKILDAGTGTGILSIAAGKLGARNIIGAEINYESIREAEDNVLLNDFTGIIHIFHCTAEDIQGQFNIILANLYGALLLQIAHHLIKKLAPQGWLIAGGMNVLQYENVITSFSKYGLVVHMRYKDEMWAAAVMQKI